MAEQTKYLLQVQCEPLPLGQEDAIARELSQHFPVKQCRINRAGLIIELVSAHPLAYGALKDLADLIERAMSQRGAQLHSGVINQEVLNPIGSAVNHVINTLVNTVAKALGCPETRRLAVINLLEWFTGKVIGQAKPVPVMYFHWGTSIDLMLTRKLARASQTGLAAN